MALLCGAAYYSAGMAIGLGFGFGREAAQYALTCVPAFIRTSVYDALGVVPVQSRDAIRQQVSSFPELSRARVARQTCPGMCTTGTSGCCYETPTLPMVLPSQVKSTVLVCAQAETAFRQAKYAEIQLVRGPHNTVFLLQQQLRHWLGISYAMCMAAITSSNLTAER